MPREPHPDPAPNAPKAPDRSAAVGPGGAPAGDAGASRPVRIAAAALLRDGPRGQEVLIARRHPDAVRGGLWEYPGGKLASGETAAEAAARELLEETGIKVDAASGVEVARAAHEDRELQRERAISIVLVRFPCPAGAQPRPLAAAECRWELVSGLEAYDWPAVNRPLNAALRAWVERGR